MEAGGGRWSGRKDQRGRVVSKLPCGLSLAVGKAVGKAVRLIP